MCRIVKVCFEKAATTMPRPCCPNPCCSTKSTERFPFGGHQCGGKTPEGLRVQMLIGAKTGSRCPFVRRKRHLLRLIYRHSRRRPSKVTYVPDLMSNDLNCVQPRGPTVSVCG